MWITGFIFGAALVGAAWAVFGWRESKPDKHAQYIREWKRSRRAWFRPHKAKHRRKTMPLFVRTVTVRAETVEAPLPADLWGNVR